MSSYESFHPPMPEGVQRSVLRYALLFAASFLVGAPAAHVVSTNLEVSYTAEGALWIRDASRQGSDGVTPMEERPTSSAWIELLRSNQVLEPVVLDQRLYIKHSEAHALAFASFAVAEQYAPGAYTLRVGREAEEFRLLSAQGALIQEGAIGLPIGRNLGFIWTPPRSSLAPGATVEFSVSSVRDAAQDLAEGLTTALDREGNILRVTLSGRDRLRVADVLNAVMDRHTRVALRLTMSRLERHLRLLEEQLGATGRELTEAERDLEEFRIGMVGRSSDQSLSFAEQSIEEERLRRRVQTAESLHNEVQGQVETARLYASSSIAEVLILDVATVTERPNAGLRLLIAMAIFFGCLSAGVACAFLIDRVLARS